MRPEGRRRVLNAAVAVVANVTRIGVPHDLHSASVELAQRLPDALIEAQVFIVSVRRTAYVNAARRRADFSRDRA